MLDQQNRHSIGDEAAQSLAESGGLGGVKASRLWLVHAEHGAGPLAMSGASYTEQLALAVRQVPGHLLGNIAPMSRRSRIRVRPAILPRGPLPADPRCARHPAPRLQIVQSGQLVEELDRLPTPGHARPGPLVRTPSRYVRAV